MARNESNPSFQLRQSTSGASADARPARGDRARATNRPGAARGRRPWPLAPACSRWRQARLRGRRTRATRQPLRGGRPATWRPVSRRSTQTRSAREALEGTRAWRSAHAPKGATAAEHVSRVERQPLGMPRQPHATARRRYRGFRACDHRGRGPGHEPAVASHRGSQSHICKRTATLLAKCIERQERRAAIEATGQGRRPHSNQQFIAQRGRARVYPTFAAWQQTHTLAQGLFGIAGLDQLGRHRGNAGLAKCLSAASLHPAVISHPARSTKT